LAGVDQLLQQSHVNKRQWMESEKRQEKSDRNKDDKVHTLDSSNNGIFSSPSSKSNDTDEIDLSLPTTICQAANTLQREEASVHDLLSPSVTSTLD
jgi:hypothetical protein